MYTIFTYLMLRHKIRFQIKIQMYAEKVVVFASLYPKSNICKEMSFT